MRERKSTSASALRTRVCACDDSVCVRQREGENKRALSAVLCICWQILYLGVRAMLRQLYSIHMHMHIHICLCVWLWSSLTGMYLYLSEPTKSWVAAAASATVVVFLTLCVCFDALCLNNLHTIYFVLFINIHMDKKKGSRQRPKNLLTNLRNQPA